MSATVPAHDYPPLEEAEAPLPAEFSEDALAVAWVKRHGKNWRYVSQWSAWFHWLGDRWQQERTHEPFDLARNITREALLWPGINKAQARQVNSAKTAGAMLQFVKADRSVAATIDQWDNDSNLLGVPGGVLDLSICKLIAPEREQYITKQAAVTPTAGTPTRWLEFLATVTNGNADVIAYLQRFAGYCLTGDTSEHAMAFLYGTGANGKTTFVQVLLSVLKDYALTAPIETFAETKNDRHSTELARLRGARLVATEETSTGSKWNESRIKTLTGGNRIAAHFMRQDDFEFMPEFKLLIAGNHKPQMRAVDEAMKRRMHIVPFTVTIPEEERDAHLQDALRAEWPQILTWILEGCAAWRDYRLAPPEEVRAATELYLQTEDTLGAWLEECCERGGQGEGRALYQSFSDWCTEQGEHVWGRRAWSNAMIDKGFEPKRNAKARMFNGITVRMKAPVSMSKFSD